jgi:hypothetical protein
MDKENVVYTHNGMFLTTKKKEILSFVATQMELKDITSSENSQAQKDKHSVFLLLHGS